MVELGTILYELVKLIGNNNSHIKFPWKKNSNYNRYFTLIKNNNKLTEDDVAIQLGYSGADDKAFIRLQQRFENKLSYLIFAIDQNDEGRSNYAKSVQTVVLLYAQGKLLIQRSLRPAGMYYLNKAMNLSKTIFYTEYEYLLNIEFYIYYSSIDLNVKKKEYYQNALAFSKEILEAEIEVKSYESELLDLISKNIDVDKINKKSKEYGNICQRYLEKYFSYNLVVTCFQIIIFDLNNQKKFNEIYGFCEKIKNKLEANKMLNVGSGYLIERTFLNAYISNGDFDGAYEYMKNHKTGIPAGSHRYFTRMNQEFLVLIRIQKYKELLDLVLEVFSYKSLEIYTRFHEVWLIKKGYMHLIIELEKMHLPNIEVKTITKYKLNKLLNQISIYSKDKTGQNASLRILEMCFYIVRKQEDKLVDKIESVQQYAYKYLKNKDELRLRLFIRMLIECNKRYFNVKAIRRHTEKYFKKLQENPQLIIDSAAESEVIPLEYLWERLLQFIEENYKQ